MNLTSIYLPASLNAGDSISGHIVDPRYKASSGWTLVFNLRNDKDSIDISSEADGDAHIFTTTATSTESYIAGKYTYRARMIHADGRADTVSEGNVLIRPSFARVVDARTAAQTALDNVDALLAGKATKGVYEYEIGNRRLKSYTMAELLKLRSHLTLEVSREAAANGGQSIGAGRKIRVRFGHG